MLHAGLRRRSLPYLVMLLQKALWSIPREPHYTPGFPRGPSGTRAGKCRAHEAHMLGSLPHALPFPKARAWH